MPNQHTVLQRRRIPAAKAWRLLAQAGLCNELVMRFDPVARQGFLRMLRQYRSEALVLPNGTKLYYIQGRWYIIGYHPQGHDTRKAYEWLAGQ